MSKSNNYADLLFDMIQDYVKEWNTTAKEQGNPNEYVFKIIDGDKPLSVGGNNIKHYKACIFYVITGEETIQLFERYFPLKNQLEGTKTGRWKLDLCKNFLFECYTNFSVMAHAMFMEHEKKLRKDKQIGSMVGLDGQPLVNE